MFLQNKSHLLFLCFFSLYFYNSTKAMDQHEFSLQVLSQEKSPQEKLTIINDDKFDPNIIADKKILLSAAIANRCDNNIIQAIMMHKKFNPNVEDLRGICLVEHLLKQNAEIARQVMQLKNFNLYHHHITAEAVKIALNNLRSQYIQNTIFILICGGVTVAIMISLTMALERIITKLR